MFLVLVDGEKSYADRRFLILLNYFFLELQDTDAITCDYLRQHQTHIIYISSFDLTCLFAYVTTRKEQEREHWKQGGK